MTKTPDKIIFSGVLAKIPRGKSVFSGDIVRTSADIAATSSEDVLNSLTLNVDQPFTPVSAPENACSWKQPASETNESLTTRVTGL